MADRKIKQKTVAPEKIANIDDWLRFYKQKYGNLVQNSKDGTLLVLDPTTMDVSSPVKTIKFGKAIDAIAYINGSNPNMELRAQCQSKMEAITAERQQAVQSLQNEYLSVEKSLLETVRMWKSIDPDDLSTRATLAREIGGYQTRLRELDESMRTVKNPHRFIQDIELSRMMIDYTTRDERKVPYSVYKTVQLQTMPVERSIVVETV